MTENESKKLLNREKACECLHNYTRIAEFIIRIET